MILCIYWKAEWGRFVMFLTQSADTYSGLKNEQAVLLSSGIVKVN